MSIANIISLSNTLLTIESETKKKENKVTALFLMIVGTQIGAALLYMGSSALIFAPVWGTSIVAFKHYLAIPGALLIIFSLLGGVALR